MAGEGASRKEVISAAANHSAPFIFFRLFPFLLPLLSRRVSQTTTTQIGSGTSLAHIQFPPQEYGAKRHSARSWSHDLTISGYLSLSLPIVPRPRHFIIRARLFSFVFLFFF